MTSPYYYRIKDKITGIYYVGCRYSKGCDPKEFWVTYFTSSETIWKLIEESGLERFEVQKVIPKIDSYSFETKVLRKVDSKNNPMFYNKHNNDFGNGFGLDSYLEFMAEKYGVDHPSKVPEIKEKMVSKMTKTRNSEEWKNTKGVEWSNNISNTLKERSNREDWNEIDKERRNKISVWNQNPENKEKKIKTLKNTLQTEYYQNEIEPKRVEGIIEGNKSLGNRQIVEEIREIKQKTHYKKWREVRSTLGIKRGWYKKPEKDLIVLKERIKDFLNE